MSTALPSGPNRKKERRKEKKKYALRSQPVSHFLTLYYTSRQIPSTSSMQNENSTRPCDSHGAQLCFEPIWAFWNPALVYEPSGNNHLNQIIIIVEKPTSYTASEPGFLESECEWKKEMIIIFFFALNTVSRSTKAQKENSSHDVSSLCHLVLIRCSNQLQGTEKDRPAEYLEPFFWHMA